MTTETNNDPQRFTHPMPPYQAMPYPDDEIDLREVFATLWARKKFIGIGVLLIVLVATAVVLSMPDIYRAKTLVRPGIISQRPEAMATFTKKLVNYKGRLDAGEFSAQINKHLQDKYPDLSYVQNLLKVAIPNNSDALSMSYDTPVPEFGKAVLSLLISELRKKDNDRVNSIVMDLQLRVRNNKEFLSECKIKQDNIAYSIVELQKLNNNSKKEILDLSIKRKKFIIQPLKNLSSAKSSNVNFQNALFHNSLVIQNRQYFLDLKREQRSISAEIGSLEDRLQYTNELVKEIQSSIDEDMLAIQNIKNFKEIVPVIVDNDHVSPNRKIIILMSFVCGIFVMVFTAFVVEYVMPHNDKDF
ncbi:Wzz/FepE/Etk N-terminal domain-containing protein [Desulfoluna butyratoxydans]|uniref:Polysaccharide chain length determinant n-terminal domain n=1 Tax=Desulfoluna butyratoxydans TaxID=231438 RepID=A0A4U8YQM3_9BACT|nr:Wzz/FepE/Etk N-terminal domain-containing protein [Desulfoluna butyratoxydans]VFQ46140.1 polysaccharide chain length determinant n-terminal domain [Desulfoluna butyratoxydans]